MKAPQHLRIPACFVLASGRDVLHQAQSLTSAHVAVLGRWLCIVRNRRLSSDYGAATWNSPIASNSFRIGGSGVLQTVGPQRPQRQRHVAVAVQLSWLLQVRRWQAGM